MFRQRFGGLVNLNVHDHVIVPDGVFVDDGDGLGFRMLPVPTSNDVLAILDRIVRQVAKRLAREARDDDDAPERPDVLAQVHAEAAARSFAGSGRVYRQITSSGRAQCTGAIGC